MADIGTISLTEIPHFRRLVTFLADVESLAETTVNDDLQELVNEVRKDLADMSERNR